MPSYFGLGPAEVKLAGALICLMVLDVLTGWLAAIATGTVSSRVSWQGVTRKVLTVVVVLVVAIINVVAPAPLQDWPLLLPCLIGYIGGEVYSILENVKRAGIPLPSPLDRMFDRRVKL